MKIAIIGSGISGLVAAYLLHPNHEITVFEAAPYVGGHTRTETIKIQDETYHIDAGFIVYNEDTYPNFTRLLKKLNVPTQSTEMSFSVMDDRSGLQYRATNLNTLFADRSNLFRPRVYRMIYDILRFGRMSQPLLENPDLSLTLGEFLDQNGFSKTFTEQFILPMGGAIWSTSPEAMLEFPAAFFIRFFHNHGFLKPKGQPVWRVIQGGSRNYIPYLTAGFEERIEVSTPVRHVRRHNDFVTVETDPGHTHTFDHVIFATHSNQALRILSDASELERSTLQSIPYIPNEVIMHTDTRVLPENRRAWASWNVRLFDGEVSKVTVSYWMNKLQGIDAPHPFIVSLNCREHINPEKIIKVIPFEHPHFTCEGMAAQEKHPELINQNRTSFCGAYWRNGFHEDGVVSALRLCKQIDPEVMV